MRSWISVSSRAACAAPFLRLLRALLDLELLLAEHLRERAARRSRAASAKKPTRLASCQIHIGSPSGPDAWRAPPRPAKRRERGRVQRRHAAIFRPRIFSASDPRELARATAAAPRRSSTRRTAISSRRARRASAPRRGRASASFRSQCARPSPRSFSRSASASPRAGASSASARAIVFSSSREALARAPSPRSPLRARARRGSPTSGTKR